MKKIVLNIVKVVLPLAFGLFLVWYVYDLLDEKEKELQDRGEEVEVIIKKINNEDLERKKEECKVIDKKRELNKRIGKLKGKLGNRKIWHEAYDRACPDRKFDI